MVKSISISGDINIDEISDAIKKLYSDREIKIETSISSDKINNCSNKEIIIAPIDNIFEQIRDKDKKLQEAEEAACKAVLSIQTFQKQQQALFDEFVLLRQRYDEQKASTVSILWTHCTKYHPDLRQIPDMKDPTTFTETDEKVGEYDVGDFLGEGQFATVKNCTKHGESKEYALKIINKERITSFTALMRVSNEIDNLKELDNPHIVTVRDVLHTENILYIITEKGGRDLFDFFDEHPDGVPEKWAKDIIKCILKGVMYCHEQGICHRDLKPENILLTFDPDNECCIDLKLCDFGLSTKFKAKTLLTDFCGSPGFFAPEMIIHGSYYGDKADVWSMGCILLELVAGHEKFCDVWMVAYDYEILQDKNKFTESISETVDELPGLLSFSEELNSFILKFLELKVSKRPHTLALCSHPWLDGLLDDEVHKATTKIQLTGDSGRFPTSISSPSTSSKNLVALHDAEENQKKIQQVFNNLSERERHQLEQYILGRKKGKDHDNNSAPVIETSEEAHHSEMHLPPIIPATPNLTGAKKILRKGMELADSNHFSPSSGFHSPSTKNGSFNTPGSARRLSGGHSPHPLQSVSESLDEEAAAKRTPTNMGGSAKSEYKEQAAAAANQSRVSLPNSPSKKMEDKPGLMNSHSVRNIAQEE